MNMEERKSNADRNAPGPKDPHESVESQQDLNAEQLQAEYRRAYLEQLRRQACPGCGEDDLF